MFPLGLGARRAHLGVPAPHTASQGWGSQTRMTSCLEQGLEPLIQGWARGMLAPWESKANTSLSMGGKFLPRPDPAGQDPRTNRDLG